ncbi:unnamed protein product [Parnassius apollo]|uniref:(apollo) hypothetical protein n=1 Tax=Parnassius apollo TaxID=110799 RepID=A0A8S3VZL0_PARAO|nr:unnamed protein product [Parnassius apollo]
MEGGGERKGEGSDEADAAHDAHDVNDDLSLYDDEDDDDDDDEEAISDEAENGDWRDVESATESPRCSARRPAQAETAASEPAGAGSAGGAQAAPAEPCRRLAESTPDLVLDLPARAALTADTFLHNRDTLKKRPTHRVTALWGGGGRGHGPHTFPASACGTGQLVQAEQQRSRTHCPRHMQTCSEGGAEAREGTPPEAGAAPPSPVPAPSPSPAPAHVPSPPHGSPVPARNTLRVAAKFAELTLTGGSLKPALAAKPALLRRPTPHPHARAAPAQPPAHASAPPAADSAPAVPAD